MANHSRKSARRKSDRLHFVPPKPYPTFPLTPHSTGTWMKKIKGRLYYFGRWGRIVNGVMERLPGDGWEDAKKLYDAQKADLEAGRDSSKSPVLETAGLTVKELCKEFLHEKKQLVDMGKRSPRTWTELQLSGQRMTDVFGRDLLVDSLGPEDFKKLFQVIQKTCGPTRQVNEITRVKSYFIWAVKNDKMAKEPNYGTVFVKPDKAELDKHRNNAPRKLFSAEEIRRLIDAADTNLKAVIYLGINTGCGNTDISALTFDRLDLSAGWLDYPRRKNGKPRRIPLWPETISAIMAAIESRPKLRTKENASLVFLSVKGEPLVRMGESSRTDEVTSRFGALLRSLHINGRTGLGFYSLRRTFATIGLQSKDRDAVKALMGHLDYDVLSLYDQTGPFDERRLAVTNLVRSWLLGENGGAK